MDTAAAGFEESARARQIGRQIELWFGLAGRSFVWRSWTDPYRLAVAEVLLQRTRAEAVASFVESFFERYPTAAALSSASIARLERDLAPLGLQHRRAATLRALASDLAEKPARVWQERPGVGQYIGRAMAVHLGGASEAMVDTNFIRVIRRAFDGPWRAEYRTDARLQALARAVVDGADNPKVVNWGVLDLGATVCRPADPLCHRCPIASLCRTGIAAVDAVAGGAAPSGLPLSADHVPGTHTDTRSSPSPSAATRGRTRRGAATGRSEQ